MEIGTRVTGHITTSAGRTEFSGTVTDTYSAGGRHAVTVMCDDGQERTAPAENLHTEQHVTSVLGGKTHLADADSPVLFPCCGSASRNTRTHFRSTSAPVDCRECAGILTRRAARLARETTAPQPGDRVTIVRDQDPYLPTGAYVGLTGRLITDHSANGDDVVRYTVRFGDGTGRRGDRDTGWVWCAEVRPV